MVKMRESSFRERQTGAVTVGGREVLNVLGRRSAVESVWWSVGERGEEEGEEEEKREERRESGSGCDEQVGVELGEES